MQAPFRSLMIDLLEHNDRSLLVDVCCNDDIPWSQFALTHGTAGFASFHLSGGVTLQHMRVDVSAAARDEKYVNFCRTEIEFTEPVLQVLCILSGEVEHHDLVTEQKCVITQEQAQIGLASQSRFALSVASAGETECLHFTVGVTTLREWLGLEATELFCQQLESTGAVVHALGHAVMSPFQYSLDDSLPVAVRKLRIQACILEFFSSFFMRVMAAEGQVSRHRGAVNADVIRQYIRQHYRECVTLADVASAFGVTTRTINNILVKETGMPAARLMREQRLSLAHEMIQQTDMPLVELSSRLGYRHLSNFSIAFKKLFGYAPNVLRQSEQAYRSPSLGGLRLSGAIDWKKL